MRVTWRFVHPRQVILPFRVLVLTARGRPEAGNSSPRAILPVEGEQIVMSPSLKGNNCFIIPNHIWNNSLREKQYYPHTRTTLFRKVSIFLDFLSSLKISRAFNGFLCVYNSKQHHATTRAPALYARMWRQRVILPARVTLPWYLTICRPPRDLLWANQNFIVSWWILMRYNKTLCR